MWQRARRKTPRGLSYLVLAIALLTGACASPGAGTANPGYVSSDGAVRTWPVETRGEPVSLGGETFTANSIDTAALRGQVVVINSWYASCPPCRAEAPDLVALWRQFSGKGVFFFGINGVDEAGSAQAFERTFDIPYESLADRHGHAIAALEGVVPLQAVPTTVVLDREGRVAATFLGVITPSTLEAVLKDLLAEGN